MSDYTPIAVEARVDGVYEPKLVFHHAQHPGQEGSLAVELVARWGTVAAIPDGEDSAGRAKLRLQTPDELAERAVATSVALFRRLREAGLLVDCPRVPTRAEAKAAEAAELEAERAGRAAKQTDKVPL